MKLASLRDGTRDGQLLIVSTDFSRAMKAHGPKTLLGALENWSICEQLLRDQAKRLEGISENSFAFDPAAVLAPLPRAPQWLDASAYRTHSELVCEAWKTPNPFSNEIPLMYQGASDDFLPAHGPSYLPDEADHIDLEAEVAVVVDEVPMGIDARSALDHIKLVMLANDVSLRAFGPREMQAGFGFLQAKPSTVFSPVAVTVDELGQSWQAGRLHRPVTAMINHIQIGAPDASHMTFSFGDLIAHAARTRRLSAGTIIGSGTVSDPDRTAGSATLAELRAVEMITHGEARTPFLKFGDRVEIDAFDESGRSIFGRIDHHVLRHIHE
jgi:fumarylacetoacetate (FAA) hydrolase